MKAKLKVMRVLSLFFAMSIILSSSGKVIHIQQNSQRMAINWKSYNVKKNERVHYMQPDRSSVSLNRILGSIVV